MLRVFLTGQLRAICAFALLIFLAACGGGSSSGISMDLAKDLLRTFDRNGVYWNPAEPGTGFFYESQGGMAIVTFYMYETTGKPVWYSAIGKDDFYLTGTFKGTLKRFSGGQPATSTVQRTPTSTDMGEVQLTFQSTGSVIVDLPGRSYTAQRFNKPGTVQPASPAQPETGIYWNPEESGRGYTVEVSNGSAVVGVFHYDQTGHPVWHLVVAPFSGADGRAAGPFLSYSGGQSLSGPYKPNAEVPAQGEFGLEFTQACSGKVQFPGMAAVNVTRFAFGVAGTECRSRYNPATSYLDKFSVSVLGPTAITGDSHLGGRPTPTISFKVQGDYAGDVVGLYFDDPGGPFATVPSTSISLNSGHQIFPEPLTRQGRYQGNLRIFLCQPGNCKIQFKGSPLVIPYDFNVGPGFAAPATPVEIAFRPQDLVASSSFKIVVPARTTALSLKWESATDAAWSAPGFEVDSGGNIKVPHQETSLEMRIEVTSRRNQTPPRLFMFGNATGSGALANTSIFAGSADFKLTQAAVVDVAGALRPLAGAPGWWNFQGNAARTGFVPASLDASKFTRRFTGSEKNPTSAVAEGGRVCIGANPTPLSADSGRIQCMDEATGKVLWSAPYGGNELHPPAIAGGRLVVSSSGTRGRLSALNMADGATLWNSAGLVSDFNPPTTVGDAVFAGCGAGMLCRFDAATGQSAWITAGSSVYYGTIAGAKLLGGDAHSLARIDAAGGASLGTVALGGAPFGQSWGALVVDANLAAYGATSNRLVKIHPELGAVLWKTDDEFLSPPVVAGDLLYVATKGGLQGRSRADGSLKWTWRAPKAWSEIPRGGVSLVLVGKYAFVGDPTGTRAVDVESGQAVWFDSARGPMAVSANGILYISDPNGLVAINLH
jgi:outer membrane protein assembly factor BamB